MGTTPYLTYAHLPVITKFNSFFHFIAFCQKDFSGNLVFCFLRSFKRCFKISSNQSHMQLIALTTVCK